MENLFWIGLLLTAGYFAGIASDRFRLPKISGYILVGIVLSPSVTHILPASFLSETDSIVHFALSVIAFMIGGSLKYTKIRKLEKSIVSVMLSESEAAFVLVASGLFFYLFYVPPAGLALASWKECLFLALLLGALSSATAPAAVLAVIHQYRAKGPFTTTLLGVVATDDAVALINFTLVLAVVSAMSGDQNTGWYLMLLEPLYTIGASLLLGVSAGWLYGGHIENIRLLSRLVISVFALLILLYTSAEAFGLDGLLVCMAFGVALVNKTEKADEIFQVIQEHFEEIIFVLFFIISGASVELGVLADVWQIALAYVLLRMAGKMAGCWFGAGMVDADASVKKYAGAALMPQAGVAIGLALTLYHHPDFGELGLVVLNTVIAATAINEIIGPLLLKRALFKAGEAKENV